MIEINLLPEELIVKTKAQKASGPGFKFDKIYVIYALPLVLALFLCIHLILGFIFVSKNIQFNSLDRAWKGLEAKRSVLGSFQDAHSMLTQDAALIQQLSRQRVNWASKLNKISLSLPSGVWFNGLSVDAKTLTLQGSVISLQKEEMGLIDKFMDALRDDPAFFGDFTTLEVGHVLKKTVGGYEVADFAIKGDLQQK